MLHVASRRLTGASRATRVVWRDIVTLACFAFGVALLVNIHPLGDGLWFWYADELRHGVRLYRDLHLALQPLFVLQTEWAQQLFGTGWVVGKLPAVLELALFCLGLRLISRYIAWPDWQGAILLSSAFCLSALFAAYRVDDYHVITDCLQVFSIVLLLRLNRAGTEGNPVATAGMVGVLSGLAIVTRLNDGGLLLISTCLALVVIAPSRRVSSVCIMAGAASATVLLVVLMTGDTVGTWAANSIFHVAASKGGSLAVLRAPLRFPFVTVNLLFRRTSGYRRIFVTSALAIACALWLRYGIRSRQTNRFWIAHLVGPVLLMLTTWKFAVRQLQSSLPAQGLAGFGMLLALLLCLGVAGRLASHVAGRSPATWHPTELLLLIPMGQMLSASMSSAGRFESMTGPFGVVLLLFPICSPYRMRRAWQRTALMVPVMISVLSVVDFKAHTPYSWHTYVEGPMFHGRAVFHHPAYGPMILERSNLNFMQPLCETIHSGISQPELLSLPFPYPNYFCGVTPWHGYVQTFFDTTSAATISRLMDELRTSPPQWIVYQRQLAVLEMHENTFNQGRPLPQRSLDTLVEARVHSGAWTLVSEQTIPNTGKGYPADWLLIRTRR